MTTTRRQTKDTWNNREKWIHKKWCVVVVIVRIRQFVHRVGCVCVRCSRWGKGGWQKKFVRIMQNLQLVRSYIASLLPYFSFTHSRFVTRWNGNYVKMGKICCCVVCLLLLVAAKAAAVCGIEEMPHSVRRWQASGDNCLRDEKILEMVAMSHAPHMIHFIPFANGNSQPYLVSIHNYIYSSEHSGNHGILHFVRKEKFVASFFIAEKEKKMSTTNAAHQLRRLLFEVRDL